MLEIIRACHRQGPGEVAGHEASGVYSSKDGSLREYPVVGISLNTGEEQVPVKYLYGE